MQISAGLFALALAGFSTLVAAQPHKHLHHRHNNLKPRDQVIEWVTKYVDQNGNPVTVTAAAPAASTPAAAPAAAASSSPKEAGIDASVSTESVADDVNDAVNSIIIPAASSSSAPAPSQSSSSSPKASTSYGSGSTSGGSSSGGSGTDVNFPDGELSCDDFPSQYGAILTPWVTKQGWSGIQVGNGNGDGVGVCSEGALCSYACPPGYSKAQWPESQPADGQSRGGLLCKNGKLHLTRPSYPKLCQAGKGTATVVNNVGKYVSICRTDYPGSENMVVPLGCSSGSSEALTVPDGSNSYEWQGKQTSAQYYVNPAGTSVQEGCQWGSEGGDLGNWSPIVLGAGYSAGKTWVSISQNQLNSSPLNFNIKIVASDGTCKYEDGQFTGTGAIAQGCTVGASGDAQFILY